MRHGNFGKHLSRSSNERRALIRNLMRSLILHGGIKTSITKAKAVQSEIEKLITKAKRKTDATKRDVFAHLPDKVAVSTLYGMLDTRFSSRTSGYTRIIKIGARYGDASEQVILSFVDEAVTAEVIKPEAKKALSSVVSTTGISDKKETVKKPVKSTKEKAVKKSVKVKAEVKKKVVKSK